MCGETMSFKRIFINSVAVLSSLLNAGFVFYISIFTLPQLTIPRNCNKEQIHLSQIHVLGSVTELKRH